MISSTSHTCALYINVCIKDLPYLSRLVPHMIRGCNYKFDEILLVVDSSVLIGEYVSELQEDADRKIRELCDSYLESGLITRVIYLDDSRSERKRVYKRFFGANFRHTKDHRGAPFYGYLYPLLELKSDYVVHLDSDMLFYSDASYSWVKNALDLMDLEENIFVSTPLSGPPTLDGSIDQPDCDVSEQEDYFELNFITTRKFLINRKKLLEMAPIKLSYVSPARRTISKFSVNKSALWPWEVQMTHLMERKNMLRAELKDSRCWTLHTPDHGKTFIDNLDKIISRVEKNDYPETQCGKYDLILEDWI